MKNRQRIIIATLVFGLLLVSGNALYRKRQEKAVVYDFYEKYYFSRLESYSDEMLEEHFRYIPDQTIEITTEMLKSLDASYEQKLSKVKADKLRIKVLKPYRDVNIQYKFVKE